MTSAVVMGLVAIVIGVLAFWQRERIANLAGAWNKRMGAPDELTSAFWTPKAYGIGALLMALAGLATVVYSLVTGRSPGGTGESEALWVIVVSGTLMVILLIVGAVVLYRRYKK